MEIAFIILALLEWSIRAHVVQYFKTVYTLTTLHRETIFRETIIFLISKNCRMLSILNHIMRIHWFFPNTGYHKKNVIFIVNKQ